MRKSFLNQAHHRSGYNRVDSGLHPIMEDKTEVAAFDEEYEDDAGMEAESTFDYTQQYRCRRMP